MPREERAVQCGPGQMHSPYLPDILSSADADKVLLSLEGEVRSLAPFLPPWWPRRAGTGSCDLLGGFLWHQVLLEPHVFPGRPPSREQSLEN